jgi:hypothetical protein
VPLHQKQITASHSNAGHNTRNPGPVADVTHGFRQNAHHIAGLFWARREDLLRSSDGG